jgi:parallel beta-helix repeat protein
MEIRQMLFLNEFNQSAVNRSRPGDALVAANSGRLQWRNRKSDRSRRERTARGPLDRHSGIEALESRVLLSTYYVSPAGSDSAAGGGTTPWKSLQKAADAAVAGDTVIVKAGTYNAGMNFYGRAGGTQNGPVTFRSESPLGAVITHSATTGVNASLAAINLENGGSWYVIDGFKIVSDGSMQRAGVRISGGDHHVVRNCEVSGAFMGMLVSRTTGTLLEDNKCHDSTDQHGIYVGNATADCVIRGNELYNNNWDGLHMNALNGTPNAGALVEDNICRNNTLSGMDIEGVTGATFRNNLVYRDAKHGITIHSQDQADTPVSANCTFENNTIVHNGLFGIQIQAPDTQGQVLLNNILISDSSTYGSFGTSGNPSGLTSDYNVVMDNVSTSLGTVKMTLAQWRSSTGQDTHSIIATSTTGLFVNDGGNDFHLRGGALAIDAGAASLAGRTAPVSDFSGNARPQGADYDAGAYEYASTGTSDTTAPTAGATASNLTTAGGTSQTFTVTYSDNVGAKASTFDSADVRVTGPNNFNQLASFVAVDTAGDGSPRTVTYRISAPGGTWDSADNGAYTLAIEPGQVTDTSGNAVPAGNVGSFNVSVPVADTTPPTVTSRSPAAGATGVAQSAFVTATFSEAADPASISFVLRDAAGNAAPATVSYDAASRTATLDPSSDLAASVTYTVSLSGAKDAAGNVMSPVTWTFATTTGPSQFSPDSYYGNPANYTPLTPSRWQVANDQGDARLFLNTTSFENLSGDRLGELSLAKNQTLGDFDATLRARSPEDLAANAGADYAVVFGYIDANNYAYLLMNSTASWTSFHAVVNGVRQNFTPATVPGIPDNNYHDVQVSRRGSTVTAYRDGTAILSVTNAALARAGGLGVGSFNDAAYFDDISFMAVVTDTTAPVVTSRTPTPGAVDVLRTSNVTAAFGEAVDPATISFELRDASGNLVPAAISYDSATRTATLNPTADLAGSASYTAMLSGAKDLAGNAMSPASWSFSTAASPPDAPSNLTTAAVASSRIDLQWADNSDDESGFQIERRVAGGTFSAVASVGANVTSYSDIGLSAGTTYEYRLSAVNSTGQSPASNVASATTPAAPTTSVSLWDGSDVPAVKSSTDRNAVELGMKFQSDVDGYVTGVRFYKGANNTGTHVGSLWTSDGTLLARVTFTNETASGWQEATFSSPVLIKANTTYIVSYFAPNGGYAYDNGYFANSRYDGGPLHALSSAESGGNGVYRYGSGGGFPKNSYKSTNYWVDVIFVAA